MGDFGVSPLLSQNVGESSHCGSFSIFQALAEPLRRQLYQAPVSKLLLASTIVSGFGDCIWDGSPGGAVSGWPFLQSLLHFFCLLVFVFRDRVSLYSPSCPGTHSVDQAGLKLRNPPASASQVLGLKACATTAGPATSF